MGRSPCAEKAFMVYVTMWLYLVVSSHIVHKRVSKDENTKVSIFYTDGSVKTRGNERLPKTCGVGPNMVFFEKPTAQGGGCYVIEDLDVKYGSVNQIFEGGELYVGSPVTMIDVSLVLRKDTYGLAMKRAAIKGSQGKLTDIVASYGTGDKWLTDGFVVLRLQPSSKFVSKVPHSSFCSVSSLICKSYAESGSVAESFIFSKGVGTKLYTVGNGTDSDLTGMDKYMPMNTTVRSAYPMGIDLDSYFRGVREDAPEREARFVSIALATATLARVEMANTAMGAAFGVADTNFAMIAKNLFEGQVIMKKLAESVALEKETRVMEFENQRTLNSKNYHMDGVLEQLTQKAKYLEDFALKMVIYFQNREILEKDDLDDMRGRILKLYPGSKVLEEKSSGIEVYYTLQIGSRIASGTIPGKCHGLQCRMSGVFYHYQREGVGKNLESPSYSTYTCGVYIQDPTPTNIAVLLAKGNTQSAVAYAGSLGLKWLTVTGIDCPEGIRMPESPILWEAEERMRGFGMELEYVGFDQFRPICGAETAEKNTTDYIIQQSAYCGQIISVQEAKDFAASIRPVTLKLASTLNAMEEAQDFVDFYNSMSDELRERFTSTIGNLIGIPADIIKAALDFDPGNLKKWQYASLTISLSAMGISVLLLVFSCKKSLAEKYRAPAP